MEMPPLPRKRSDREITVVDRSLVGHEKPRVGHADSIINTGRFGRDCRTDGRFV